MKNTISQQFPNSDNLVKALLERINANIFVAMPAIVVDVNYKNQTLSAIPTIKGLIKDGNFNTADVQLPPVLDVPFSYARGGNWTITIPIAKDDEILLVFCDYDFSAWFQDSGIQKAEHLLRHHYSNAVAIVGISSEPRAIKNYSSNAIEIRNIEGTQSFILTDKSAIINFENIILNGNTKINGAFETTGETTLQGKKWLPHTHGNGNEGKDTTGVN